MRFREAAQLGCGVVVRRALTACFVWLFSFALPCTLAAADADVVRLSIPDCEDASGAEIAKLVGLELAPKLTTVIDESLPASMHASLHCAELRATITVEDEARATPLELTLSLADTRSEARARLLALAVAELIATSRLERSPARPPPLAAVPESSTESRPELWREVWLGAGVMRAFEPGVWLPALAVGAADSFGRFAGSADAGFAWGEQRSSAARIRVRVLSLSLAPALQLEGDRVGGSLAVGLRAGYAWLLATPREAGVSGRQLSGVFLAPVARGALELRVSEAWRARLGLELGYVIKPVRGLDADQSTLLALRGVFASALLAIAWRW
jgi:hypothetical protein